MPIKTVLDKDKPYGTIVGERHDGALYEQDGIRFNAQGHRLSELTAAEQRAQEADDAVAAATRKAAEARDVAARTVAAADVVVAAEAAAEAGPKPPNPEMPDFTNYTKADMINHARNKFQVAISPGKTWMQIKLQLEGLY